MSQILNTLKIVQAKRVNRAVDSAAFRRQKLATKIDQQMALLAGEVTNGSNGEGQQRRSRPWWFTSERGMLCLSVRYGSRVIELAKGKNAIEVGDIQTLSATLQTVKQAVLQGELDTQIAVAADAVKARFKKK